MKTTLSIIVLVTALGIALGAQTLAEQLQKGIYTEETVGNKEEAARIYRQILAAPTVPESISTEAQRRLARLLLTSRPGQAPSTPDAAGVLAQPSRRGVVEQGRYRHVASGITFDLPPGWSAGQTFASSDDGDLVTLTDGVRSVNVWMIQEATPADQVLAHVAAAPAAKLRQRHSGYGIPGMPDDSTYDIPADTVKPLSVNGRPAMAAVGTYVGFPTGPLQRPDGLHQMREYMTWICTPQSRAFFFARVLVEDLAALRPVFDQIVNSAVIP